MSPVSVILDRLAAEPKAALEVGLGALQASGRRQAGRFDRRAGVHVLLIFAKQLDYRQQIPTGLNRGKSRSARGDAWDLR